MNFTGPYEKKKWIGCGYKAGADPGRTWDFGEVGGKGMGGKYLE
jgi:hypothetical protein